MKIILRLESSITLIFNTRTEKKGIEERFGKHEKQNENEEKEKHHLRDAFLFVTSSGETSNFLMEDLELILQLESIDNGQTDMNPNLM